MKNVIPAAALCLVLASSAFAQDVDPETRFHRAYEQEVVEGKTADAARVYLAMMDDAGVPARLRQEAKFRFAVTATLLGRADEARAHLNELAKDATAPESLRARAAEYLDATKSIGVGSELDKKLQTLVFDLAQVRADEFKDPTWGVPAAYRDFEVIGKRAVPFLRQLLAHADLELRRHAFRLLLRLREPGTIEAWTPELNISQHNAYAKELKDYLDARPEERAAFEKKLLALDDKALAAAMTFPYTKPRASPEFLRAAAARKSYEAVSWLSDDDSGEAQRLLRVEWIRGDDAQLASKATTSLLRRLKDAPTEAAADAELLPVVVERLRRMPLAWKPTHWDTVPRERFASETNNDAWQGFDALARAAPTTAVLDALEASIAQGAAANADDPTNPLTDGLVEALVLAAREREPQGDDLKRFASLLRAWAMPAAAWTTPTATEALAAHVRFALDGLPRADAESLAAWAVAGPETSGPRPLHQAIPFAKAADVPVALAALRAAGPLTRKSLFEDFGLTNDDHARNADVEFARAVLAAMPEMWRLQPPGSGDPPLGPFSAYASLLPVEEARARLADVAAAAGAAPNPNSRHNEVLYLLGMTRGAPAGFRRDVAAPSLGAVWTAFAARQGEVVTDIAVKMYQDGDEGVRAAVAPFLLAHVDELYGSGLALLAKNPALFPPAKWVPRAKSIANDWEIARGSADDAAREMTSDPAAATEVVVAFVAQYASDAARREIFGKLLRSAPSAERRRLFARNAEQGPPEAAEEMLQRELSAEKPDFEIVRPLVYFLAESRPSDRLFPAVRLLLGAADTDSVRAGVTAAKSLGREELLPALVTALDSLESNVRSEAKEAIDSIVALRTLKDEARRNASGK